ncbi:glycosyltransferase family 2 protein [Candidatus Shapirobacteria bacterium]|nr:glycosyltransferase family 2 protein [Candidatus Shapirobacteria bacterium]
MINQKLSAIIIAKNEEEIIGDCLESIKWADEIVVIDTGCADKTPQIAKEMGAKVFEHKTEDIDYSAWRNFALRRAWGEWVFYVDADERVSPLLRKEILSTINNRQSTTGNYSAFAIPRRNIRLTRELHWGGWWPDYVLRLIKKDKLKKWVGKLHEQPEIDGEIGKLTEPLIHYSHRGAFEHKLANTVAWSGLEAQLIYESGHPKMNVQRFLGAMGREFYERMIKCQAWRDGAEGVIEAIYQVFSVFITYARLWEKQINTDLKTDLR